MDYLVPGWHQLLNDWAYTVPMVEFDDAVSHLQILPAPAPRFRCSDSDILYGKVW